MKELDDKYQQYTFTVTGTVYATSEDHANHFVYWALEDALKYEDASHAIMRLHFSEVNTPATLNS